MKRKKLRQTKAGKLNIVVTCECSFEKLYSGSTIEGKYSSIHVPKARLYRLRAGYVHILHSGNLSSKKGPSN